jgi:anti-sigma regulatory factor (Ser/Thr protein kinase)
VASTLRFPSSPASVRAARAFVADELGPTVDLDTVQRTQLLVSELATNVVEHARTGFVLDLAVVGDLVRISITDGSSDPPVPRSAVVSEVGGRGLSILDQLSERWGCDVGRDEKTVWCEIRATGGGGIQ